MSRQRFVCLAVLGAFVTLATLAPRGAHADATSDRKAKAHAKTAKAYFDTGDFAHAIVEYQAAYDLDHKPSRLYNLAVCHERSGDAAGALALYRQYLEADPGGEAAKPAAESIAAIDRDLATAAAAREQEAAKQRAADEERAQKEQAARDQAARDEEERRRTQALPKNAPIAAPAPAPAPLVTTPASEAAPAAGTTKRRHNWLWAAAAGAAIVTGVIIDQVPASASNGKLDGTDFVPLGFYALGATFAVAFVF
jgi:tetratricopeptide (TPR) repeat protein